MDEKEESHKFSRQEYLEELTESLSDPFHKRIIKVSVGENPVELGAVALVAGHAFLAVDLDERKTLVLHEAADVGLLGVQAVAVAGVPLLGGRAARGPIFPARAPKGVGQNRVSATLTPLCRTLPASSREYAPVVYCTH